MALREGYGTGSYSAGKYGVAEVLLGQAAVNVSVTTTASGKYVIGGQEYDDRLRDGYGKGRYGVAKYGQSTLDKGASAVSVTSSVSQADAQRVQNGVSAPSCAITTTVNIIDVRQSGATATPAVTTTAQGFFDATGQAVVTPTLTTTVSYVRIRPFSASEATTATVTQRDARFKWIPRTSPSDTWTEADYRGD